MNDEKRRDINKEIEILSRRYRDRFKHIHLVETEYFEPGQMLLMTAFESGLDHDAIVCCLGGSDDVKGKMPTVSFLEGEEV